MAFLSGEIFKNCLCLQFAFAEFVKRTEVWHFGHALFRKLSHSVLSQVFVVDMAKMSSRWTKVLIFDRCPNREVSQGPGSVQAEPHPELQPCNESSLRELAPGQGTTQYCYCPRPRRVLRPYVHGYRGHLFLAPNRTSNERGCHT